MFRACSGESTIGPNSPQLDSVKLNLKIAQRRSWRVVAQFEQEIGEGLGTAYKATAGSRRLTGSGVRLARFQAITSLLCIGRDCELLLNFETHLKVFKNLTEVMPKLIRGLWPIKVESLPTVRNSGSLL